MPIGWVEVLEGSTEVGCTGTTVPIGWVEVLEVLRMLDAQVLVCQSVELKCRKPGSTDVGCTGTCVPISWVEVLELLRMLDFLFIYLFLIIF